MKLNLDAGLLNHYRQTSTTVAHGIKFTRTDGAVYAFTSLDVDQTIDGVLYRSAVGLELKELQSTAGLAVGNTNINCLLDGVVFNDDDLRKKRWHQADFELIRYNYNDLTKFEVLLAGKIANVTHDDVSVILELRDVRQIFQQNTGIILSKTCPWKFGSNTHASGGFCNLDITSAPYTVGGSVTSVGDSRTFTDSSKAQADHFFRNGYLVWTSGGNVDIKYKIQSFSGGIFTLAHAVYDAMQIGDTFTAVAGCDGQWATCATWSNKNNFAGFRRLEGAQEYVTPVDGR